MTVSLDVFGDFSRLHEYFEPFQYFVNNSILCESFQHFVNYSNIYEEFNNIMNCILTTKLILLLNSTKVATRTTAIFKLIGPCEIFSHGQ